MFSEISESKMNRGLKELNSNWESSTSHRKRLSGTKYETKHCRSMVLRGTIATRGGEPIIRCKDYDYRRDARWLRFYRLLLSMKLLFVYHCLCYLMQKSSRSKLLLSSWQTQSVILLPLHSFVPPYLYTPFLTLMLSTRSTLWLMWCGKSSTMGCTFSSILILVLVLLLLIRHLLVTKIDYLKWEQFRQSRWLQDIAYFLGHPGEF